MDSWQQTGPPSGARWPAEGDPSAQEFRVRHRWRVMLSGHTRVIPLVVIFYAICVALGSLPFGGRLLPGLGIAVGPTAVLVGDIYRKARRGLLSTVVRMSPTGVELRDDRGFQLSLRWSRIVQVGAVVTPMTRPGARIGPYGGVRLQVGSWANTGLIGWGEWRIPQRVPGWVRDLAARAPRDPGTGEVEVAIPLGGVDAAWASGPMGEWVRRYRPDLMPPVPRAAGSG